MATVNKIDLNGDTYDIESSALVTTQPTTPTEGAVYYDTVNDEVKVYDGSNWNSVGGGGTVAFATSSTAGNVAEKEVSVPSITELNTGQILCIKPTASATVANLTIKLNNFTAYPIRYNNGAITTSTDDLVWNQNFVSQFVFDGTYRQFVSHGYDNNTTYTQNVLYDRGSFVAGSGTYAISRYSICLQKPDMTWEKITNTEETHSVNADKTVNTHGFLLNGEMLYYSNTAVLANGAVSVANTMYRQNSGFDMRYSVNTTGTGYTAGDYIYLVGTIGADGLFYLDSTQWWTNTLPSTNNGKVYVKVGKYVSGVTITLELDHPAYYHDGTRIREYKGINSTDVITALGYTPVNPSTLGTAATKDTGTASGNVPVLDSNGHLASSTLPGVALTDTFTVSTSSDLTTLSSADQGDIAIVSSENKTYVLSQAPYSTASNWKQILSPTGGVTSVNGQTGAVTLSIPSDTSDLTNGAGYLTSSTGVTSVNGNHGAVTVNEPKVSATAPSSPTEGMIWYDTTNDKLKTYNGSSWDEAGGGNLKVFTISGQGDTTTGQQIYDYYKAGNTPFVKYNNTIYKLVTVGGSSQQGVVDLYFEGLYEWADGATFSELKGYTILIEAINDLVTDTYVMSFSLPFIKPNFVYTQPYIPQYNGSPATKKYVDDNDTVKSGDANTTYTIKVANSDPTSGTPATTITFVV